MDGILNVLKPAGMTSFDVISFLRRTYKQKKIGHGGTLDPMAAGVLPVFMGKATRLIEYAPIHTKTDIAEFMMGFSTDTEDVMGNIISSGKPIENIKVWENACESFKGDILQVPSLYSAIKVRGQRAYDLARSGEFIELKPRPIHIYDISLLEVKVPFIRLQVTCSSGTYIRALGRDIGRYTGCPLSMSFLLRTNMGTFSINEAKTLEEIEQSPEKSLNKNLKEIFSDMKTLSLSATMGKGFLTGKRLVIRKPDESVIAVYNNSTFLGIGEIKKGILHPRKVFGEL